MLSLVAIWFLAPRVAYSLPLPNGLADTMVFDPQPDWRVFGLTLLLSTEQESCSVYCRH